MTGEDKKKRMLVVVDNDKLLSLTTTNHCFLLDNDDCFVLDNDDCFVLDNDDCWFTTTILTKQKSSNGYLTKSNLAETTFGRKISALPL